MSGGTVDGLDKSFLNATLRRVITSSKVSGKLIFPAVPALVETYVEMLGQIFSAVGRPVADDNVAALRELLAEKIDLAYAKSQISFVVVDYKSDAEPSRSMT